MTTIPVPDMSRATIEDEACSIGSAGSLVKRDQLSSTMSWDEFQNSDGKTTDQFHQNLFVVSYNLNFITNYFFMDIFYISRGFELLRQF